jgi:uncharacterized repeat protein (TIGR03803 family)
MIVALRSTNDGVDALRKSAPLQEIKAGCEVGSAAGGCSLGAFIYDGRNDSRGRCDIEDGASPEAAMVIAGPPPPTRGVQETSASSNGKLILYGTTSGGGANLSGTVFEMTAEGKITRLYSFCSEANCADGATPNAGLVEGTDGNFYGTTTGGNGNSKCALLNGCGVVFELTPKGDLTTLHSFEGSDGEYPDAGLVQATNGTFYGTVPNGGADGFGTIFSLSAGLGPFVATVPTSAIEDATINILGQDFTSSSKVKFGDLEATDVTLNGASDLIATVPKGALTGEPPYPLVSR